MRRERSVPSDVPAAGAAGGGGVAAGAAGVDRGPQVRGAAGGGEGELVDGGPQGAGDVDPGPLGLGRGGPGPAAETAGPAQLADNGLAFGVGPGGPLVVPGPVRGRQLGVQLGQAAAVGGPGGRVQRRAGPRGSQAGPAGGQVQGGDVAPGRGQQGPKVVQAAAVA